MDATSRDFDAFVPPAEPARHRTRQAQVRWGARTVTIGGDAPVRVQAMTNTDTADALGTAIQVKELAVAGSELVRITVNTPEAAQAVPYIREQLDRMGIDVPLIGDFHYNGHRLLTDVPACAEALSKYRINPGNVGKGDKHDRQFGQMIEAVLRERLGAIGIVGQQAVAVVVEIADERHVDAHAIELLADVRHLRRGLGRVHGDADHLRAGNRELLHLDRRADRIDRVGVGHRLDAHRRVAADGDHARAP